MSWAILRATLRQRRWSMLWYSLGLMFYSWVMVWFWPQFGETGYVELLENMPPELIALLGSSAEDFGSLGGYFETEYLGLMWILIVSSAVILYSVKAVASEVVAGTLELTLAQPVSRASFILARIAGLIVVSTLLTVATFGTIQVFGPMYGIDLGARTFALLYGAGFLFILAVGGFALALSAGARDVGRPVAVAGGVLGAMWLAHMLAEVSEVAKWFEPFNLLKYWRPAEIINDRTVGAEVWWVLTGVVVTSLAVTFVRFMRRDVA
ncbi:MAG: ABC transporter permease subunit [Clostridiales bacterium]|nr:ABC transporter permease subunit [Clostridiales bacterium]